MTSQHFTLNRQSAKPAGISNSAGVLLKSAVFSQNQVLPDLPGGEQPAIRLEICSDRRAARQKSPILTIPSHFFKYN
jgi:hypothetical protein